MCTCVLGTDEGHLIGVRFEADESTLPVHGLPGIRMEGVETEGKSQHKSRCVWHSKDIFWPGFLLFNHMTNCTYSEEYK